MTRCQQTEWLYNDRPTIRKSKRPARFAIQHPPNFLHFLHELRNLYSFAVGDAGNTWAATIDAKTSGRSNGPKCPALSITCTPIQ